MNVTAIRVEELDRRIIVWGKYDLDVVGHDDRRGGTHRQTLPCH
jgi:hypothetical protein